MADLIKKIKIKKQDGTFTDYIPIGAEAKNISMNNNYSVEQTIGEIDVSVDGNIKQQLDKIQTRGAKTYTNVAQLKEDLELKVGDLVNTLGYYEAGDGGEGLYKIKDNSNNWANLFPAIWTKGVLLNANGTAVVRSADLTTDYFEILGNETYTWWNIDCEYCTGGKYRRFCEYDENYNFIKVTYAGGGTSKRFVFTTDSNTKYIRFGWYSDFSAGTMNTYIENSQMALFLGEKSQAELEEWVYTPYNIDNDIIYSPSFYINNGLYAEFIPIHGAVALKQKGAYSISQDSSYDATDIIQKMLYYVYKSSIVNTLVLDNDIYKFTKTLSIYGDITIKGDGQDSCLAFYGDGFTGAMIQMQGFAAENPVKNVVLKDFILDGQNQNFKGGSSLEDLKNTSPTPLYQGMVGIRMNQCQNVTIENLTLNDIYSNGISGTYCTDINVRNCHLYSCSGGNPISSGDGHWDSTGDAIGFFRSILITVENNMVLNSRIYLHDPSEQQRYLGKPCGRSGLEYEYPGAVNTPLYTDLQVEDYSSGFGLIFRNNTASGYTKGIHLEGGVKTKIIENTIINNHIGLIFAADGGSIIANNYFHTKLGRAPQEGYDARYASIAITPTRYNFKNGVQINNNIFEGKAPGVYVGWGSANISGNRFGTSCLYSVYIPDVCGSVSITNNTIHSPLYLWALADNIVIANNVIKTDEVEGYPKTTDVTPDSSKVYYLREATGDVITGYTPVYNLETFDSTKIYYEAKMLNHTIRSCKHLTFTGNQIKNCYFNFQYSGTCIFKNNRFVDNGWFINNYSEWIKFNPETTDKSIQISIIDNYFSTFNETILMRIIGGGVLNIKNNKVDFTPETAETSKMCFYLQRLANKYNTILDNNLVEGALYNEVFRIEPNKLDHTGYIECTRNKIYNDAINTLYTLYANQLDYWKGVYLFKNNNAETNLLNYADILLFKQNDIYYTAILDNDALNIEPYYSNNSI